MSDNVIQEIATALQQDWDLRIAEVTEDAILRQLADRVVLLLERGPETFFQIMYRLDISEKKLNAAMQRDDVPMNIARLIYDRQLQKIQSRMAHRRAAESDDPELKW